MIQITLQFFAELNFFLPSQQQEVCFIHQLSAKASVKDIIESLGVPHPEIECIVVNGNAVDFSYLVQEKDFIQVYPPSYLPNLNFPVLLRPIYPKIPQFILDVHLGKLASFLRMLGFDTWYRNDYDDEELAQISATEKRILLSRDQGLLKRSLVTYGYYVRATDPQQQLLEVLARYKLFNLVKPCQRCIRCNGLLKFIDKSLILDQLMPKTIEQVHDFYQCNECEKIYWQGSHYEQIQQFIQKVLNSSEDRNGNNTVIK